MAYTFEDYHPVTPSQTRAFEVARQISDLAAIRNVDDGLNEPAMVVFSGLPGTGKTHLLEAIRSELDAQLVPHDTFNARIPDVWTKKFTNKVILGDDAFSECGEIGEADRGGKSWSETKALNEQVLNAWYPSGALVVMTSNFNLHTIQEALTKFDKIGRASSRLAEMAARGADLPILGPDHRESGEITSLF